MRVETAPTREKTRGYHNTMSFNISTKIVVDYYTDADGQDTFLGAFLMVPDAESRLLDSARDDEDAEGFVDRARVLADQMDAHLTVADDVLDVV